MDAPQSLLAVGVCRLMLLMACFSAGGSTTEAAEPRMKQTKIRGYVTEFRSPTDFDIEDYRVSSDQELSLDLDNASPEIAFQLNEVRVGVELEIRGLLNEQTGELKAQSIKVDMEQFKSIRQTAFVSSLPEGLQLLDGSWAGELQADGQTIRITDQTKVLFKPTRREKEIVKRRKQDRTAAEVEAQNLVSLDQITLGMAMTYEGIRDRDTGKIVTSLVEFSANDMEDGEAKMWASLKMSIKEASGLRPGELKINQIGKFKLVPDENVQAYVTRVGNSLVPPYHRDRALDDPSRIPFKFFVVDNKQPNAFATPNGIIVIHSGMFAVLENEAQLAAILGHEIAHATHEHTWRQQHYRKKTRLGIALAGAVASAYGLDGLADVSTLVNGALVNGHQRSLENQSDRIGLQYMVAAGYDPREAPAVWKLMARKVGVSSTDFFWSSHDNAPTRRSYLMNELKNNYRDSSFDTLATNSDEFIQVRDAVANASGKRRIKVTQN